MKKSFVAIMIAVATSLLSSCAAMSTPEAQQVAFDVGYEIGAAMKK